ncbi:Predicted dienelactone hydrolase [Duganella sp. CF402]|uniref:alpha/beta hydrolase family protein n=1 Tax=unclassified Duganella TaxID=2636909 RepID=UPI0008BECD4D|nr:MULTISPECIES: alpha/beta fold hydrolase [unclassified Duganella]RZT10750.1 putative dienelactone hydrolase [Duganella sp. BK701]SEK98543.1 Predicted dienelactone hydrolase [Duganella sp. CF402]
MTLASSCGCRLVNINDKVQGAVVPTAFLYPARGAEKPEQFGPYSLEVALDAPPADGAWPLVVISHGNSGTPWAYRQLAKHLALAGFVVALPAHTGNTRLDNSLAGTAANLANRPRHLTLAIDAALADAALGAHIAADAAGPRVAVIGHSIGGYTALAAAGGLAWSGPHERKDAKDGAAEPAPVPVTPDARIRSLVLLNPATFWFIDGSLKPVRLPILLRTGEKDELTPIEHAHNIIEGVANPALVEHKDIPGAGHFAFMSKFPPEMTRPGFKPSQDPEGFDRESIQPEFFADVTAFLRRTLCA